MRFSTPLQFRQKVLGEEKLKDMGDLRYDDAYRCRIAGNFEHLSLNRGSGDGFSQLGAEWSGSKEPLICTDVILRQEITDIRKNLRVWEAPHPPVQN